MTEHSYLAGRHRTATWARYLGAAALLAVGVDHIQQYYAAYYRAVPTIGPLFLLNFISAALVALGLALPMRRVAGRIGDRLLVVLAVSGIGIAAGSIAALLISENGGLFGFMERGYHGAIVLALSLEAAAVLLLGAFLILARGHGRRWRRRPLRLAAGAGALLALALVLAGYGGAGGGGSTSASASGGGTMLKVVNNPQLGKIIVDAQGRTLYDFAIDKGTTSVCYGGCATLWPPLTTKGAPVSGKGVKASLVGTTQRKGGVSEVTYGGHPLYYYAPDRKPGQITGQALDQFGAPWYALTPAGRELHARPH